MNEKKDFQISFGRRLDRDEIWAEVHPGHPESPLPYPLRARLERLHGRLVCTRLELGWPHDEDARPITSASLRRIPLGQILSQIALEQEAAAALGLAIQNSQHLKDLSKKMTEALERGDLAEMQAVNEKWWPLASASALVRVPATDRRTKHRGPQGHSGAFYARVADVYRQALMRDPQRPYRFVVAHLTDDKGRLFWSSSNHEPSNDRRAIQNEASARKLVYRARKRGYLGEGIQGKAGEYGPPSPAPDSSHDDQPGTRPENGDTGGTP